MLIYSVNVTVKNHIRDEWLEWMRNVHIPEVLDTGYFTGAEIYNIILPVKSGNFSCFSIQYVSESYEKFMSYSVKESKRLQKKHADKFGDNVSAERYVFEKL